MTKKDYMKFYERELNLHEAKLYPYTAGDARQNANMLNSRVSLLCSCVKAEKWNDKTKENVLNKLLGGVGVAIGKAEMGATTE